MPDWFPVLTLLIGYGTKSLQDFVQHRWTVGREREAREAARRDQRSERRNQFQRETLLELQDAAFQLSRATGRICHLDKMAIQETGKKRPLPDDLDEGYRLAQVRTDMLSVRVRDQATRELVKRFRELSTEGVFAEIQDNRDLAINAVLDSQIKLNARIGELLRTLDDADLAKEIAQQR